ncbi:MAG: glycosyl transferase family protein [Pseudomonadota bacterium]
MSVDLEGDPAGVMAALVRVMGRGPSRARSLTREEAETAMRLILEGAAPPEAVGALLMLMRYRGETAAEIAGFADAMRARISGWRGVGAEIDWPSYAAGRSRGLPWFLLSAKLLAAAGAPVLIHGWNSHQQSAADVRAPLAMLGVPVVETPASARSALRDAGDAGVAYAPLEAIDPRLLELLSLRDVLGLRSAVNTCLRVLNPSGAEASVQGVFHPPYRALQQEAGALLGQRRLLVLKGAGGEFERHPAKAVALFGLSAGAPFEAAAPALMDETRRLADAAPDPAHLLALWRGERADPFAEAIVIGTAALALFAAGSAADLPAAEARAAALWAARRARSAA